jgi:hypothetical protein
MKTVACLLLTLILVFSGCRKPVVLDDNKQKPDSGLIIKAGFVCGWGSGTDSLEISQTRISYKYFIPSTSNVPVINKSRSVTDTEWAEILNDVDLDDFFRLNYNTCNVCVDGCDEWIFIQNGKLSHQITIGKGFEIEIINKLQGKLAELRTEFSN